MDTNVSIVVPFHKGYNREIKCDQGENKQKFITYSRFQVYETMWMHTLLYYIFSTEILILSLSIE